MADDARETPPRLAVSDSRLLWERGVVLPPFESSQTWAVDVEQGRAEWGTAYSNRARRSLVVVAGGIGVVCLPANAASGPHVFHRVLVELGDVSVGGSEKCGGGGSAAPPPGVDVSSMSFLHVQFGEPSHNRVAESLVVVFDHLPWRQRASHGKPEALVA